MLWSVLRNALHAPQPKGGGRAVGSEALIDSCLVAQDERCSSRFSRLRDRFLLHIARHAGEAAAEELLRGHELVRGSFCQRVLSRGIGSGARGRRCVGACATAAQSLAALTVVGLHL